MRMSSLHPNTPSEEGQEHFQIRSMLNAEVIEFVASPKPDPVRRNPGRMDGLRWNGSSFICSSSIDARTTYDIIDDCDIGEWDVDLEEQEEKLSNATFSVSLLDIARPAKPRGRFLTIYSSPKASY